MQAQSEMERLCRAGANLSQIDAKNVLTLPGLTAILTLEGSDKYIKDISLCWIFSFSIHQAHS